MRSADMVPNDQPPRSKWRWQQGICLAGRLVVKVTAMMPRLTPPDSHHLEAAQGWLELGNPVEAQAELDQIAPRFRGHPAVLEVRWEICTKTNKWDVALETASALIRAEPDHPLGLVHQSFCLYDLERLSLPPRR